MKAFLGVVLSMVITVNMNCVPEGKLVSGDLVEIEKITGSELCATGGAVSIDEIGRLSEIKPDFELSAGRDWEDGSREVRRTILESFPSNQHPCIDLGDWAADLLRPNDKDYHKSSGFVMIEDAKIPLIVTRRTENRISSDDFSGTIIVRISGGPGGMAFQPANEFAILLGEADILIDFFYSGSGTNLIYPSPNFDVASAQIRQFIDRLQKSNRDVQIVLLGESLGGPIVLSSLSKSPKIKWGKADKVVLINPVSLPPKEFFEEAKRAANELPDSELRNIYRTIESKNDDWSSRNIVELNRADVFKRFFEPENFVMGIEERLAEADIQKVLILFGSEDPIIGVERLRAINDLPNITSIEINGMGHSPTAFPHFQEMRDAIDDFLIQ